MQPREIDLQVARALGLNVQCGERVFMGVLWGEGSEQFIRNEDGTAGEIPHYSTDIAAAMQVAMKLQLSIINVIREDESARYMVGIISREDYPGCYVDENHGIIDGHIEPFVVHEDLCMAICLAALKCEEVGL